MTSVVSPTAPATPGVPPTGWLPLVLHALAAGLGALLAAAAAGNWITGTVPRTTAIAAGALVFLVAFVRYLESHDKAVANDEARFRSWLAHHGPEAQMALSIARSVQAALPANLASDLAEVKQTANAALALARTVPVATVTGPQPPTPAPPPVPPPPAAPAA